jgi:hypothetical protein
MPDLTEADVRRILDARAEGKLPGQIAHELSEPGPTQPDDGPSDAERRRQAAEGALDGGVAPAGQVPEIPLGVDVMRETAKAAGAMRPDGSFVRPAGGFGDRAVSAGFTRLFERASAGDPEATFKRHDETLAEATERWRASRA